MTGAAATQLLEERAANARRLGFDRTLPPLPNYHHGGLNPGRARRFLGRGAGPRNSTGRRAELAQRRLTAKLLPMTTAGVFRRRNVANAGVFFVTPPAGAAAGRRGATERHRRRRRRAVPRTVTGTRRRGRKGLKQSALHQALRDPGPGRHRHLDRARAVGLLRVAARVGPEARQAPTQAQGPHSGFGQQRGEFLHWAAGADRQTRPSAAMRKKAAAWIRVGVVVRVVVAVCARGVAWAFMVAARGGALSLCTAAGAKGRLPRVALSRGRGPPAARGASEPRPRALSAASRRSRPAVGGDRERARRSRAPDREASAPRRAGAGAAAPAAGAALGCQGEGFQARRGGCRLHSPSSSSLRPSPRSSHIMAAALAGRRRRGAAARLSPRGDDGGLWRAGCPRGARRSQASRAACTAQRGRHRRKTRCFFTDFAFDDQVLRRGRLPHLARDRHRLADAASSAFAPELDLAAPQRS